MTTLQMTINPGNTRSRRLQSKLKKQKNKNKTKKACPKIKWFCPNVICCLPEYHQLTHPGEGGMQPHTAHTPPRTPIMNDTQFI